MLDAGHEGAEFVGVAMGGDAQVVAEVQVRDHIGDGPALEPGGARPVGLAQGAEQPVQLFALGAQIGDDLLEFVHGAGRFPDQTPAITSAQRSRMSSSPGQVMTASSS